MSSSNKVGGAWRSTSNRSRMNWNGFEQSVLRQSKKGTPPYRRAKRQEKMLADKKALSDSKDKATEGLPKQRQSQIDNLNLALTNQKNKANEAKKVTDDLSQQLVHMTLVKEAAELRAFHAIKEFKNSDAGSAWLKENMAEYASEGTREIMAFVDSQIFGIDWKKHPNCTLLLEMDEGEEEEGGETQGEASKEVGPSAEASSSAQVLAPKNIGVPEPQGGGAEIVGVAPENIAVATAADDAPIRIEAPVLTRKGGNPPSNFV